MMTFFGDNCIQYQFELHIEGKIIKISELRNE